jgi:hypothetical protein
VGTRNFVVKAVEKDQEYSKGEKFDSAGVIAVRVA